MTEAKSKGLSFAELGKIMLEKFGAERISKAYGIADPENNLTAVGLAALGWCDINRDGTLN